MRNNNDGNRGEFEKVFRLAANVRLARSAEVGSPHDDQVCVPFDGSGEKSVIGPISLERRGARADPGSGGEVRHMTEEAIGAMSAFAHRDEVELGVAISSQYDGVGGRGE